jgi:hypothetical protein
VTGAQSKLSEHAQYAERNDEMHKLIKMTPSAQAYVVILLLTQLLTNKLLIQDDNLGEFLHRSLGSSIQSRLRYSEFPCKSGRIIEAYIIPSVSKFLDIVTNVRTYG